MFKKPLWLGERDEGCGSRGIDAVRAEVLRGCEQTGSTASLSEPPNEETPTDGRANPRTTPLVVLTTPPQKQNGAPSQNDQPDAPKAHKEIYEIGRCLAAP